MKTNTIRYLIFTPMLLVSIGLLFHLTKSITSANDTYQQIKTIDQRVILQLKKIREAQKLFFEVNNTYAGSWEALEDFIETGEVYVIDRHEEIITRDFGGDSVIVHYDTLRTEGAYEQLRPYLACSRKEVSNLKFVPESGEEFILFAKKKGGKNVLLVEDPQPLNPSRRKDLGGKLKPLKIGSRKQSTLKGNWE